LIRIVEDPVTQAISITLRSEVISRHTLVALLAPSTKFDIATQIAVLQLGTNLIMRVVGIVTSDVYGVIRNIFSFSIFS